MSQAINASADVVSKGDFARLCKVTPGRVSQWIKEGKIGPDALDGEGVRAKIKVAVAQDQLKRTLDISQRLGNGVGTQLDARPSDLAFAVPSVVSLPGSGFEDRLKAEKLREIEMRNRAAHERELERRGEYTKTSDVRVAMGQVATGMLTVFEGALSDFALALAARFEVPQRDVLHLLRTEFRSVRTKAATAATKAAGETPQFVDTGVGEPIPEVA